MSDHCESCFKLEVAARLQRARAATLSCALADITRVKSLEKAREIARDALGAEHFVIRAMDGVPMPEIGHD